MPIFMYIGTVETDFGYKYFFFLTFELCRKYAEKCNYYHLKGIFGFMHYNINIYLYSKKASDRVQR